MTDLTFPNQELSSHFGIAAIENLMEIALRMKRDFLPFAQTTLHVALALFRVGVPPKHYLTFGIGELLQLIKDELGDYDKMQYVKILTQRLDFFFTHYFDTLRAQRLVSSLNHLYMIVSTSYIGKGILINIMSSVRTIS